MKWLKSPWFWLGVVALAILLYMFFSRPRDTSIGAPLNIPGGGGVQPPFDPAAWLNSIGSWFSSGASIMGGGGSR